MASKSLKDKSKVCESCDKKFGWNKRLVEHLDKISECKEFYISKEITLPISITKSKGPISKDEEQTEIKKDEILKPNSNLGDERMKNDVPEEKEKVSVLKIYEEFDVKDQQAGDKLEEGEDLTGDATKRKTYNLEVKIGAIKRLEQEGPDNMKGIAADLRLKVNILKSWWDKRDKLVKIKFLRDKKAELDRSTEDNREADTTLEENCGSGPSELRKKRTRRRVCGECPGCLTEDCGACKNCLDKPRFGGKNTIKQKCRQKICLRQEEERKLRGKKKKVLEKDLTLSSYDLDLSTSSDVAPVNTTDQSDSLGDFSMDQDVSSSEEQTESFVKQVKVVSDDMDELRNALGSIGADYSQSWSQESPVLPVDKHEERPSVPQMAAALELIPRTNHFPVVSKNHPSISEPEAVVTIERVEKKKKKPEESLDQSGPRDVNKIHSLLAQLQPVPPHWAQAGPSSTADLQSPTGDLQTPTTEQALSQYWPSSALPYHQFGAPSGPVGVPLPPLPPPAGEMTRSDNPPPEWRDGSVLISEGRLQCLRSLSSRFLRHDVSSAEAARLTGELWPQLASKSQQFVQV